MSISVTISGEDSISVVSSTPLANTLEISSNVVLNSLNVATGVLNTATGALREDISSVSGLITSNDSDISSLQTSTGLLSAATGNLDTKIITVSGLINSNDLEITALNSATGVLNTNVIGLQTATGSLKSDISSNDSDISSLQNATGSLKSDISSNDSDISTLQTVTGLLKTATGNLDAKIITVSGLITSNDADLAALNTATGALTTATGNLDSKIITVSGLITSNDSDITSLNTATGTLNTNIIGLQTATGSLKSDISSNDSSISVLQTATGSLKSDISSNDSEISALKIATGILDADVSSNFSTLQTATGILSVELQNATGSLKSDISSNDSDISALQTATGLLSTATGNLDFKIITVSGLITSNDTEINALNTATGVLDASVSSLQSATGALSTATGNLDSKIITVSGLITSNDTDLTSLNTSTGVLNTNVIGLQTATGSLKSDISSNDSDIASLQTATGLILTSGEIDTNINTAIANLVDSAPGTLNTLNELAAALGDDENFSTTTASSLGNLSTATGVLNTNVTSLQTVSGSFARTGSSTFGLLNVTGNVGIGTTSPENKLHIVKTSAGAVTYPLRIQNDNAANNAGVGIEFGVSTSDSFTNARIQATREDSQASAELSFHVRSGVNGSVTERMRIDRQGKVGIGTNSPATKLEVNGDIGIGRVAGGFTFREVVGGGERASMKSNSANELIFSAGGAAEKMRISNGGNVGIGTTGADSILHLSSSGPTILTIEADTDNVTETDNARIVFKQDSGIVIGRVGYKSNTNSLEFINQHDENLSLGTNNTERLLINSDGNIGIGTTSPAARLHVSGDSLLSGNVSITGDTTITGHVSIGASVNANVPLQVVTNLASEEGLRVTRHNDVDQYIGINEKDGSTHQIEAVGNKPFIISNTSTLYGIQFNTSGNNEKVRITQDGRVGIGTTSPDKLLVVRGANGEIVIDDTNSTPLLRLRENGITKSTISTNGFGSLAFTAGGSTERMRIDSSGNVGIGTTSPQGHLDINTENTEATEVFINGEANQSKYLKIRQYEASEAGLDNNLVYIASKVTGVGVLGSISAAGTETDALYWNESGNVGIGTTSPAKLLHISGSSNGSENDAPLFIQTNISTLGYGLIISRDNSSTTAALSLGADSSNNGIIASNNSDLRIGKSTSSVFSESMRITSSGNVGIGTTTPNERLHVSGNSLLSGDLTVLNNISLSGNIIDLDGDDILTFDVNDLIVNHKHIQAGFGVGVRHDRGEVRGMDQGSTNSDLGIYCNSIEAISIQNDGDVIVNTGNVGIGTNAPSRQLEIKRQGAGNAGMIRISDEAASTYWDFGHTNDSDGNDFQFWYNNGSSTNKRFHIGNDGNVGIGTTSPAAKLHVGGNTILSGNLDISGSITPAKDVAFDIGSPTKRFKDLYLSGDSIFLGETKLSVSGDELQTAKDGVVKRFIKNTDTGNFAPLTLVNAKPNATNPDFTGDNTFFRGNSKFFRTVVINGNVGIGTTSPSAKLHIQGNASDQTFFQFDTVDNRPMTIKAPTTGAPGTPFVFKTSNSFQFRIDDVDSKSIHFDQNGLLGIGTTSPVQDLELNKNNANVNLNIRSSNAGNATLLFGDQSDVSAGSVTYDNSDNSMRFKVNNQQEKMRITSAGNVGIGTTNPSAKLEVSGNVTAAEPTSSTHLTTKNYVDTQVAGIVDSAPSTLNTLNELAAALGDDANFSTTTASSLGNLSTATGVLNTNVLGLQTATGSLKSDISSNDSDISALQSVTGSFAQTGSSTFGSLRAGNVGIGITDRRGILDIYGTNAQAIIRAAGENQDATLFLGTPFNATSALKTAIIAEGQTSYSRAKLHFCLDNNGNNTAPTYNASLSNSRMTIQPNGNVGIGTTSPSSKLHISDVQNAESLIQLHNNRQDAGNVPIFGIQAANNVTNVAKISFYRGSGGSSGYLTFLTKEDNTASLTEKMRIDGAGNIGIGTTSPSAKLEVNGHFAATTKSFIIDNPEKGGRLQYGVVETDEHSVYVRGKSNQEEVELPEEWDWLVHEDSVTVQLTSVGQIQQLFVVEQNNKKIKIGGLVNGGQYNYVVYGTRKDVDPLEKHLK